MMTHILQMGNKDRRPELERAIGQMYRKTKDLRRQLRKAVVDHVSDSFLETTMPLLDLIEVSYQLKCFIGK